MLEIFPSAGPAKENQKVAAFRRMVFQPIGSDSLYMLEIAYN